jgi:hypothetical protein
LQTLYGSWGELEWFGWFFDQVRRESGIEECGNTFGYAGTR